MLIDPRVAEPKHMYSGEIITSDFKKYICDHCEKKASMTYLTLDRKMICPSCRKKDFHTGTAVAYVMNDGKKGRLVYC